MKLLRKHKTFVIQVFHDVCVCVVKISPKEFAQDILLFVKEVDGSGGEREEKRRRWRWRR